MDRSLALISLLQITDSFFPSGAFAHSWGLETCVTEGSVKDIDGFYRFLKAYIVGAIGMSDALVVKLAFDKAESKDISSLFHLDKLIHSMKLVKELRECSIQTGRQLLRIVVMLHKSALLKKFETGVRTGEIQGHRPVVFALVCNSLGIRRSDAVMAYLYSSVSGIVRAGVRLIPLGHTDGQRVIEMTKPLLRKIAEKVSQLDENDIYAFAPGIEIMAMRHEQLYVRLFKS